MLTIIFPKTEYYDEDANKYVTREECSYDFEHSLKSLTYWEEKYRVPFLTKTKFSQEEFKDYIMFMSLDSDFDETYIDADVMNLCMAYIMTDHTATTVSGSGSDGKGMVMTSEVIYAYMSMARIPFECENWNIKKLLLVLRIVGELNKPEEKKDEATVLRENKALNEKRLKEAEARKAEFLKNQNDAG